MKQNNEDTTKTIGEARPLTGRALRAEAANLINVPQERGTTLAEDQFDNVDHFIGNDPDEEQLKDAEAELRRLTAIVNAKKREKAEQARAENQARVSIGTVAEGVAIPFVSGAILGSATAALKAKMVAALFAKFVSPIAWALGSGISGYAFGRLLRAYRDYTGSQTVTLLTRLFMYGSSAATAITTVTLALLDATVTFGTASAAIAAFAPALGAGLFMGGFALGDLRSTGGIATNIGNRLPNEVAKGASVGYNGRFFKILRRNQY